MKKIYFFLSVVMLLPFIIQAQWSNDPMTNLEIKNSGDWEAVPHIISDEGGCSYISWFSGLDLNFNVYMQRLDAEGNKLWGEDGLLLSDHITDTWVTDYSLTMDLQGNAVLATQDLRTGNSNVFVYRMSPGGDLLWGEDGLAISDNLDFNPYPKALVTESGDIIFSWTQTPYDTTQPSRIVLQKVTPDGTKQWGDGIVLQDTLLYFFDRILLTDDGNLLVVWQYMSLPQNIVPGAPNYYHIRAQKFNMDGSAIWPSPVQVDTGNMMDFPTFYTTTHLAPDGEGGVFICWMTPISSTKISVFIQRLDQDGGWIYETGPLQASANPEHDQVEPVVTKLPDDQHLYLFWREIYYDNINLRYRYSVYGQKLTPEGERIWGDQGKQFNDFVEDSTYFDLVVKPGSDNDMAIFYALEYLYIQPSDTAIRNHIFAFRIDSDGQNLWGGQQILLSGTDGEKYDIDGGDFANDQWIVVWNEMRGETGTESDFGIYAQNIRTDGSLGPVAIQEGSLNKTMLRVYPNPVTEKTTIELFLSETSDCEVSLYNMQGQYVSCLFIGRLPGGKHLTSLAGTSLLPGVYCVHARIGDTVKNEKILIIQ
ncbi:MAG: T9SS type A sorting domain-containing protein [Bacteroidetes bacterium]|nr:T9SS type A sorting domain-containing protein [Bacteroidota bacterium]